ncbi:WD40/YVTN/BNR-like repeat-containing protein [Paenibacillus crassostreae]|uniref:Xyloglucanase n=1 Tax=Paenibacillus crassostreae TaxID=1763538 RepID=A0A162KR35_9BACL|nr:xyloglucanase [Paenibacillus crassostreae]AOZ92593.1 xyloglucanase [Paenibacillus crassostreae]OAB72543.1 xyloglucanase [Paenibacillus crassostreae]
MFKKVLSLCLVATLVIPVFGTGYNQVEASNKGKSSQENSINTPKNISSYEWGRAKVVGGGFIPGIIYNQKEKDLVYARTDMGGAYRWNATTKSWTQLMNFVSFDEWNMLGVESMATDPVDTNRLYIASGTYTNDWTTMNGVILRSTDKGNSFERTELPFKLGGNMPGRSMGERLAIDPNNNKILYLGTRSGNGLWKSTDYGETWNQVKNFPSVGNVKDYYSDDLGVVWVTFDPSTGSRGKTTQTIYVGVADTNQSIYRSTDGGQTWAAVPNQPRQGYLPHHGVLSSKGQLFVSYAQEVGPYNGGSGSLWKFNSVNGVWTDISPTGNTDNPYGGLAVDAQNPDIIMVATMNKWWPDEFIYRSTDGGLTWKSLWTLDYSKDPVRNNQYTLDYSLAPWLDWGEKKNLPEQNPKLGWMIGDLEIDPFNSDRILYGTGATLFGSSNMTALDRGSMVNISVQADGIEETAVLGLISPPSGASLISSMGDIGGFRHADLTKAPTMITNPTIGTSTDLDYAEYNPNIVVRVGNADGIGARMGVSTDNGVTWRPANNAWVPLEGDTTQGGHVAVGADGKTIVWSPSSSSDKLSRPVSYSTDLGATWIASRGIPEKARVSADRVNAKKFYGFSNGTFYVSTDGGATFYASNVKGLPTTLSSNFKALHGKEGDIWIGAAMDNSHPENSFGLWHSTDSGATFTKLNNVQEAATIGFGKAAPGKDYMSLYSYAKINNKYGIYRSDDAGASWVRINDDKNQFGSANAAITGDQRVYGRVYVATNGLGIVIGDIKQDTESLVINLTTNNNKVNNKNYVLSGTVSEDVKNDSITIKHNNKVVIAKVKNRKFNEKFTLVQGQNTFVIEAVDLEGNNITKSVNVEYDAKKNNKNNNGNKNNKDDKNGKDHNGNKDKSDNKGKH